MSLLTPQIPVVDRGGTKMFLQIQVTRMFQLSKLDTADQAVVKLLDFGQPPKARAGEAHSCHVTKEATVHHAHQITGDRR